MSKRKINLAQTITGLSKPRLTHFQSHSDKETLLEYNKNVKLAEATYPALQQFEIVLRNNWELVFIARYGSQWYVNPSFVKILDPISKTKLQQAILDARKHRKMVHSGDVVAELTLGFWTFLFSKTYEFTLWRNHAKALFPNCMSSQRNIRQIRDDLRRIRELRNRVAHHEPICKKPLELWSRYETIVKLLEWMNPDVALWLRSSKCDRFPSVFNAIFHPKPRKKKTP